MTATPVPILSDNYAWLLKADDGSTAIVDPADAAPVIAALEAAGGRCDLILLTHHHADHVAGTDEVRARFASKVAGAAADAHRLPRLDLALAEGDTVILGKSAGRVMETPGHTRGHISYYFADGGILLPGDTLFSLGCGKLLEGNAEEMFTSLAKFRALPDETLVCCGHEYTESNARFALTEEPQNAALVARAAEAAAQRKAGLPTLPARLGTEQAANPFLHARDAATLGAIRARKDRF